VASSCWRWCNVVTCIRWGLMMAFFIVDDAMWADISHFCLSLWERNQDVPFYLMRDAFPWRVCGDVVSRAVTALELVASVVCDTVHVQLGEQLLVRLMFNWWLLYGQEHVQAVPLVSSRRLQYDLMRTQTQSLSVGDDTEATIRRELYHWLLW
jgi:hypothetical protein